MARAGIVRLDETNRRPCWWQLGGAPRLQKWAHGANLGADNTRILMNTELKRTYMGLTRAECAYLLGLLELIKRDCQAIEENWRRLGLIK